MNGHEVMRALGISSQSLYQYKKKGKLRTTELRGDETYVWEDVEKIVKENRRDKRANIAYISARNEKDDFSIKNKEKCIIDYVVSIHSFIESVMTETTSQDTIARPQLKRLLEDFIFEYYVSDLYVWTKSDISSNAQEADFFEWICNRYGTRIIEVKPLYESDRKSDDYSEILPITVIGDTDRIIRVFIKYGEEVGSRDSIYCSVTDFCAACFLSYDRVESIIDTGSVFNVVERNGDKYLSIGGFQLIAVDLCTSVNTEFSTFMPFFKSVTGERVIASHYFSKMNI